jgi:hypothetical protein
MSKSFLQMVHLMENVNEENRSFAPTVDPSDFLPGIYLHYKGGKYRALFLAQHHETREYFVGYVSLEKGSFHLREWASEGKDSWCDTVDPHTDAVPRFKYLGP